jgi:phosphoglycolate phosphatase
MIRVIRPIPVERLKLLVFDLDGTLIDSAQDLCNSVNATLAEFDRAPLPDAVVGTYIGDGALMLVRRALFGRDADEVDEDFLARAYAFFLDYYREHKLDFTYAYGGVLEALTTLRTAPDGSTRSMSVLTNKPVRPAQWLSARRWDWRLFSSMCMAATALR